MSRGVKWLKNNVRMQIEKPAVNRAQSCPRGAKTSEPVHLEECIMVLQPEAKQRDEKEAKRQPFFEKQKSSETAPSNSLMTGWEPG